MQMTYIKNIFIAVGIIAAFGAGATTAKADPIIMNAGIYQSQLPSNYAGSGPIIMSAGTPTTTSSPIIPDMYSLNVGSIQQNNNQAPIVNNPPVVSNQNQGTQTVVTATTIGSSAVATKSARLSGSFTANAQSATWFEYGITPNSMNTVTATRYQNTNSGTFAETISGLSPNTTYYYRAVTQSNGVFGYGTVKSFTTGETVAATSVLGSTTTAPRATTIATNLNSIQTQAQNTNICSADKVNYTLTYANSTSGTITNAMLVVTMPAEVDYAQATAQASYNQSNRTVTIFVGTLAKGATGTVYLSGTANGRANGTQSIATRVDFTYNKADGTNETTTNYIMYTGANCGNLGANALGAGFLPTSFTGWVLLIILICAIVYIARKYFSKKDEAHGAHH